MYVQYIRMYASRTRISVDLLSSKPYSPTYSVHTYIRKKMISSTRVVYERSGSRPALSSREGEGGREKVEERKGLRMSVERGALERWSVGAMEIFNQYCTIHISAPTPPTFTTWLTGRRGGGSKRPYNKGRKTGGRGRPQMIKEMIS